MPNWCYNQEIIIGPKNEIKDLYTKLNVWASENYVKNGFGASWLGNIVYGAGFKRQDEDMETGLACRGSIVDDFDLEIDENNNTGIIRFASQTAWGAMPEMWFKIVEKFAPHCKYFFCSEEPGMMEYYTNDTENEYFTDEYRICGWYENEDSAAKYGNLDIIQEMLDAPYMDAKDLEDYLQDLFNLPNTPLETLIQKLEEANENGDFGEHNDISILCLKRYSNSYFLDQEEALRQWHIKRLKEMA